MPAPPLSLLLVAVGDDVARDLGDGGWTPVRATGLEGSHGFDAVLLQAATKQALRALARRPGLAAACLASAVIVVAGRPDDGAESELLQLGVEAIVPAGDAAALRRAVRHAVQRKRIERQSRTAFATDLATGLPHQAQLLEQMAQLLALREREPAPMVLVVLRVAAYGGVAVPAGGDAAAALRRKVAVRLRGALRASDIVASIGPDTYAVLLGRLDAPADGERVAAKLVRALQSPLQVAGQPCAVAAAVGLARYPEQGRDALALLHHATVQADAAAARAVAGAAPGRVHGPAAAANDDNR